MVTQFRHHSLVWRHMAAALIGLTLLCSGCAWGKDIPPATVLHVASERHTSLALNYAYFPHVARAGFGISEAPWHTWYGTRELRVILHLPGYQAGQEVNVNPAMIIGSRFGGKIWTSGFEALRSFDTDQNGIVERDEIRDLYLWRDFDSDGIVTPANLEHARWTLVPATAYGGGFDLRKAAQIKTGYARQGRLAPHAVMMRGKTRIHLLELPIHDHFTERYRGYMSYAGAQAEEQAELHRDWSGTWQWQVSNETDWESDYQPWSDRLDGKLLLAVQGGAVRGIVQYTGRHGDLINLPLQGRMGGQTATWTSVSPLGLTRSEVTLSWELGRCVLSGEAWSNRNGNLQRWQWKAFYVENLK